VVVADTSVWIPFFTDPGSVEKHAIDALIDERELALAGVVLAELLQGCRTPKESQDILDTVTALDFLETTRSVWQGAGDLSASLRRKGITIPLTDLIIAALALEHDCQVYTLDPHFEKIPGLSLYQPPKNRVRVR
jgi:predicted nucleic acid-binding protein